MGWEPYAVYTFRDPVTGRVAGADVEVIEAALSPLDCDVELVELPWTRILLGLEHGDLDLASSASHTPERERWAYYTRPYREAQIALFVRRGDSERWVLKSLADIAGQRFSLGTIAGYHYTDDIAALLKQESIASRVDSAVNYETNIRKLLHGHLDAYLVEDVAVMIAEAKALGVLDRLERHPLPLGGEPLHFVFSRATVDPALVEAVDERLQELKSNGTVARVIEKYLR